MLARAIRLEPRLPLAHRKLGEALAALGRGLEADAAFEEYFEQDLDKGRVAVSLEHMRAGRTAEAIEALRGACARARTMSTRCVASRTSISQDKEHLGDAEALLRQATSLAPDYAAAWLLLGGLLHELGRHHESVEAFRRVTEIEPRNAGRMDRARQCYAHSRATSSRVARPTSGPLRWMLGAPGAQMGLGHVLKTLGDQAGALRAYRAAIAAKPDFGEVYWSMANLKVFRSRMPRSPRWKSSWNVAISRTAPEIHFRFALGKAREDRGDYDRAWHYYDTGNRKQRQQVFHDPVMVEARHDQIVEVFDREFLERNAGTGDESAAPIFIVGLPRSGSTLIEQILASHSQVEGTQELPTLSRLASRSAAIAATTSSIRLRCAT